ncbi:MAG TPA: cytochrome c oxidase assembly protein [Streptosporangiaceae bacterium]
MTSTTPAPGTPARGAQARSTQALGGQVRAPFRTAAAAAITVLAAATAGLLIALVAGGAVTEKVIPGLGDAGTLTRWGLPLTRLALDVGAALTVGALLAAAVLLPSDQGRLGPAAAGYLRAASWLATGWAAAAGASLVFTVSDVLGEPVGRVVAGSELSSYAGQLPQGLALMLVVLLAVMIALMARTTVTAGGALGLLALAVIALLPPPLTGHSASSPNHTVAVVGLALHVCAVVPWVGGLAVLGWHALRGRAGLAVVAGRFSRLALWCYAAVGFTGVANAVSRLPDPAELFTADYGRLILVKFAAFCVLGWAGWLHRGQTLPAVAAGRPRAFARLATVEAAIMAGTIGVAVALARTAPPAVDTAGDSARELLGYPLPPPVTTGRLATLWVFDLFWVVVVVALGAAYAGGVVRLRRRGDSWPAGRTTAWFVGLATIAVATLSGVGRYAPVLFSVHMVQHMTLSMLTPVFLVLGAPVTLALRALRPAAVKGDRGAREWLTIALHSRAVGVITHPLVATFVFVASTYTLYFTGLFGALMRNHLGHIAMLVHFLASGALFFWVIIGVDPAPRRLPYVGRLLVLFVTMPFHAFFGIALMNVGRPIAPQWYGALHRTWGSSLVADVNTGGAIAWAFGEIPVFIVLLALVFQWFADDQRLARRADRAADRAAAAGTGDDELSSYNAYLAALARRARHD